jgi:adenosine deaminase
MHYTQVYNSQTVPAELARRIRVMPKVEIHVHLEGAAAAGLVFDMAQRNHVSLPAATPEAWQAFYAFRDFDHFIEIYLLAVACMRTPQDFVDMVTHFMAQQAAQNVQYSEVFVSAALHYGKFPPAELVAALAEGARLGRERSGVEIAFIPDLSRQSCQERALQEYVLAVALHAREKGIGAGMGIGGNEVGYPPGLYRDIFAEARRQGLRVVAHGGETTGPESVRGALDELGAERIGHGLSILDDPVLAGELAARRIPIEVSPQSNYCTRVVAWDRPHPIRRMLEAGLLCTLNSDDPQMFATDLNNEYLTLAAQGFSFEELWTLNLNGLEASFMDPVAKARRRAEWAPVGRLAP